MGRRPKRDGLPTRSASPSPAVPAAPKTQAQLEFIGHLSTGRELHFDRMMGWNPCAAARPSTSPSYDIGLRRATAAGGAQRIAPGSSNCQNLQGLAEYQRTMGDASKGRTGGQGGIRTLDTVAGISVFETQVGPFCALGLGHISFIFSVLESPGGSPKFQKIRFVCPILSRKLLRAPLPAAWIAAPMEAGNNLDLIG